MININAQTCIIKYNTNGQIIRTILFFKKSLITISLLNNNAPDSIKNNGTAYMKICLKEIILKCNTSALGKKRKICELITPKIAIVLIKSKYFIL